MADPPQNNNAGTPPGGVHTTTTTTSPNSNAHDIGVRQGEAWGAQFSKGFMGGAKSPIAAVADQGYLQASQLYDIHENLVQQFGSFDSSTMKTTRHLYNAISGVQDAFGTMETAGGLNLMNVFDDWTDIVKDYENIMSSQLLQVHGTREEISKESVRDLTLFQKALDFTSGQTRNFLQRQFALTGEINDELLQQTLAYSKAVESATGVSSKVIAENISGMMSDVETFGMMTVEEMSEAAASIVAVGLEVTDLQKLVKNFNTFESAADSVSKLTQVFGVQMDAMEYMQASFERPQDMLAMIQEDFELAGVSMSDMGHAQKQILSQVLGGMGVQNIEQLFGEAGSNLSSFTESVASEVGAVNEGTVSAALSNADADIARINQMSTSFERAQLQLGQRLARAMGGTVAEHIRSVGRETQDLVNQIPQIGHEVATAIEGELKTAFGLDDNSREQLRAQIDIFRTELEEIKTNIRAGDPVAGAINAVPVNEANDSSNATGATNNPGTISDLSVAADDMSTTNRPADLVGNYTAQIGKDTDTDTINNLIANLGANRNFSETEMSAFADAIKAAVVNQAVNITLVDTVEGFQARLDTATGGATIVTVSE